jgi:hypothetical protein
VFFGIECFFRVMATLERPAFPQGSRVFEVQEVHAAFKQLVDKLGRLFDLELRPPGFGAVFDPWLFAKGKEASCPQDAGTPTTSAVGPSTR